MNILFICQSADKTAANLDFFNRAVDFITGLLPHILTAAVILIVGIWLTSVVKKLVANAMLKAKVEQTVISFVVAFVNVALKLLVIITALAVLGVNVTSIITAFGAALVAVGLAMQNSLSNIASGILIILIKSSRSGDLLEFEGTVGTVSKIELFNTFLTSPDGKEIIIPNSRLTANNVINCNYTDTRRLDLSYTIGYDANISKVKGLIYSIISECDSVLDEPSPVVAVGEHGAHGVQIVVRLWLKNEVYYDVYHSMQEKIKLAFDENGIEIPYEQLVVHTKNEQ